MASTSWREWQAKSTSSDDDPLLSWAANRASPPVVGANDLEYREFLHGGGSFGSSGREEPGVEIRGLASKKAHAKGEAVVQVPESLLITDQSEPVLAFLRAAGATVQQDAALEEPNSAAAASAHPSSSASSSSEPHRSLLGRKAGLVAFLASELRRGANSRWEAYLWHLPKLADYQAFHPLLLDPEVVHSYAQAGLPVAKEILAYQAELDRDWKQWSEV